MALWTHFSIGPSFRVSGVNDSTTRGRRDSAAALSCSVLYVCELVNKPSAIWGGKQKDDGGMHRRQHQFLQQLIRERVIFLHQLLLGLHLHSWLGVAWQATTTRRRTRITRSADPGGTFIKTMGTKYSVRDFVHTVKQQTRGQISGFVFGFSSSYWCTKKSSFTIYRVIPSIKAIAGILISNLLWWISDYF